MYIGDYKFKLFNTSNHIIVQTLFKIKNAQKQEPQSSKKSREKKQSSNSDKCEIKDSLIKE